MESSQLKTILQILAAAVTIVAVYLVGANVAFNESTEKARTSEFAGIDFTLLIYYFPERKKEAIKAGKYFQKERYTVQIKSALDEPAIKQKRLETSYFFFNHADLEQAMEIKQSLERVLGFPVNSYRRSDPLVTPSLMLVLTEKQEAAT